MAKGKFEMKFYDVASTAPLATFAPNPWKTRYALNFKNAEYETVYVPFPDVTELRKNKLGIPPSRFWSDGSEYYTLPILTDSNGIKVGDSFDIALYLDEKYPEGPKLFPPGSIGLMRSFNLLADKVFPEWYAINMKGMPVGGIEYKQTFMDRSKFKGTWEEFTYLSEEKREALFVGFEKALEEFSKAWKKRSEGPFLEGAEISYADMIVGGWLKSYKCCLSEEEWERIAGWQDGLWGKLERALDKYTEMK